MPKRGRGARSKSSNPRKRVRSSGAATAREITVIHRLATLTNSEVDLDRIMSAIVTEAASAFRADAASVALEDEHGFYSLHASYGLSENFRAKRKLSGDKLVALYGDPPTERLISAAGFDAMGQPELLRAERIESIFLVPLVHRSELVGSLALYARGRQIQLSSDEIRLAQLFAAQAAGALQRARAAKALAERIDDYDLLTSIGRALVSRLDVDYEAILRMLHEQLGFKHLAIFSLEGAPPELVLKSYIGYGDSIRGVAFPLGAGVAGWVAQTGETAYVPDVSKDPRYIAKDSLNLGSLLVYPLKVGAQVLGVLSIDSPEPGAFSMRDRRVLAAFADQCAIALSNSQQYATTQRRSELLVRAQEQLEEYTTSLEKQKKELQLLNHVTTAAATTLDLQKMLETVVKPVAVGLSVERCAVSLYDARSATVRIAAEYRTDDRPSSVGESFEVDSEPIFAQIIRDGRAVVSNDLLADPRFIRFRESYRQSELRGCAMVPITGEDRVVLGRLTVNTTKGPRHFTSDEINALQTVANQLALGITNARLYEREQERASEDSLTQLRNHRALHESLDREVGLAVRSKRTLSIVIIDLDDFKLLNDTYGHQVGDEVLRAVAAHLKACLRETDVAGRYGGDEFFIILPDTDEEGARFFLDRFGVVLAARSIEGLPPEPIRWSAGIAVCPRDGRTARDLIARADAAMYQMKRAPELRSAPA